MSAACLLGKKMLEEKMKNTVGYCCCGGLDLDWKQGVSIGMMRSIQVNALNLAIFSIIFIVFVFLSSPAHCIPLTEEAWNNWEYLSLPEQLVYILDDGELQSLKEEHALLGPATLKDLLVTHR